VLHNAGTAPAATLAVEFFGPPAGPDPDRRDLGSATVRLPTGAARVEVRRQRFVLGAVDQIAALPGPELVVVETGAVELALHPGTARVTRIGGEHETVSGAPGDPFATAEPDPMEATEAAEDAAGPTASAGGPAVAALNGTVVGLGSGAAAALEAGAARTLQGVDVGESVVLVIGVVPAVPVPATPAP
jgi:hypothetical protein